MHLTKFRITLAVTLALFIIFVSASTGWLSGYDFNVRNGNVAFWYFFTVLLATIGGVVPLIKI